MGIDVRMEERSKVGIKVFQTASVYRGKKSGAEILSDQQTDLPIITRANKTEPIFLTEAPFVVTRFFS